MLELFMRFLPSVDVKTPVQVRFLFNGPGAVHVGRIKGREDRWESW